MKRLFVALMHTAYSAIKHATGKNQVTLADETGKSLRTFQRALNDGDATRSLELLTALGFRYTISIEYAGDDPEIAELIAWHIIDEGLITIYTAEPPILIGAPKMHSFK